jgi:hypothetical protein
MTDIESNPRGWGADSVVLGLILLNRLLLLKHFLQWGTRRTQCEVDTEYKPIRVCTNGSKSEMRVADSTMGRGFGLRTFQALR